MEAKSVQPCSFCGNTTAAVSVGKTKLCLLHYYTTLHNRRGSMTVIDETAFQEQSSPVQELFADVFLEVRQELQEATVRNDQDPLNILHQFSSGTRRRKSSGGGFLRKEAPIPARLRAVQQEQQRAHDALTRRMNGQGDITQRRQPTRKSIWNAVLAEPQKTSADSTTEATMPTQSDGVDAVCSSCGSSNVEALHSSQRRHDMAKAETWSNKDREGDVFQQYRCGQCGKVWQEQE